MPAKIIDSVENLGEILAGDLIENSPYEIRMKMNDTCKLLCKQTLTPEVRDKFKSMIHDEYLVNWIVDNLPAATRYVRRDLGQSDFKYMSGFPVGIERNGKFYIHNHVRLTPKRRFAHNHFEHTLKGGSVQQVEILEIELLESATVKTRTILI